jgi:DNA polymerase III alpha subunit
VDTFPLLPAYAELFAFWNFTFLYGASRGEELVLCAKQLGYSGLAITDECTLAGVVRAHVQAKEEKFPLVIGSYFKLVHADTSPAYGLILLAKNREGYRTLSAAPSEPANANSLKRRHRARNRFMSALASSLLNSAYPSGAYDTRDPTEAHFIGQMKSALCPGVR